MSECAVIWCGENSLGRCLIDEEVDGPVDYDSFYCPQCDVVLHDGLVLPIPEEAGASIGELVEDCLLAYVVDDPKAKTLVVKEYRTGMWFRWVAVRARPEVADTLRVFPHVDGDLACEHVLPGQQELELGV